MAREITDDDLNAQQKARGQRIDKQYYKKMHPWRFWMRLLSWLCPLVAAGIIGIYALSPQGASIYLPGPVATKHSIFAHRCDACHDQGNDPTTQSMMLGAVSDAKCMACHDGPLHMENQEFAENKTDWKVSYHATENGKEVLKTKTVHAGNPSCASCHTEHKGHSRLAELSDGHCGQCHASLKVSSGTPKVKASITSFDTNHPEWSILKNDKAEKDTTPFKFSHAAHFKSSVKKEGGALLTCNDCHTPDKQRKYMLPISFDAHCASCHLAGTVTAEGISLNLPHHSPALVQAVVKTAFTDPFIKAGGKVPGKKVENPNYVKPKPGRPKPKEPEFIEEADPRTPEQYLTEKISDALKPNFFPTEKQMDKSCLFCHKTADESNTKDAVTGLPKILDPKIPEIWLPRSVFGHEAHRVVNCAECHVGVEQSTKVSDLMIPGVESCKTCHKVEGGARSGCVECHVYHDKKGAGRISNLTIDQLRKGAQSVATPAPVVPTAPVVPVPAAAPEPVKAPTKETP
jgi:hypothetical protein